MAPQTALDVKQAVSFASAYLSDVFKVGDTLLLEEVEALENGGWSVTLSFDPPHREPYKLGGLIVPAPSSARIYKVVTLDPAGTPVSVKMR